MMNLYYVTCVLPSRLAPEESAKLTAMVDSFLHALRPPPTTPEVGVKAPVMGNVVQVAKYPEWLLDELTGISPHVSVLIMPLDPARPCVLHPEELRAQLKIDRHDWDATCVQFARIAAG